MKIIRTSLLTVMLTLFASGCATTNPIVRLIFKTPLTIEELQSATSVDVCEAVGLEMEKGRKEAFINATNEAQARLNAGDISLDDCKVFAQMGINKAIRQRQASAEAAAMASQAQRQAEDANRANMQQLNTLMENNRTYQTKCVETRNGMNCNTR